jgi:hypothetical protein
VEFTNIQEFQDVNNGLEEKSEPGTMVALNFEPWLLFDHQIYIYVYIYMYVVSCKLPFKEFSEWEVAKQPNQIQSEWFLVGKKTRGKPVQSH